MERPCRPVSHGESPHPGLAILGAIQTVTRHDCVAVTHLVLAVGATSLGAER